MISKKIGIFLVISLAATAVLVLLPNSPNDQRIENQDKASTRASVDRAHVMSSAPVRTKVAVKRAPAQSATKVNSDLIWKDFQTRFGDDYEAKFSNDGRLVSIRMRGASVKKLAGFNPENPQKAIARANEILEYLKPLLKVTELFPLQDPVARGNAFSAQVFFKEMYQGLPFASRGDVTVDLGAEGELIALYSDYYADIQVTNQAKLEVTQAKEIAKNQFEDIAHPAIKSEGGRKVVWAQGQNAKIAYEFMIMGRQVIIDAETGMVLSTRDKRQF